MHLKCLTHATYPNYFTCTYETTMSVNILHMNSNQSIMSPQALVYICFTFFTYAPKQIYLVQCICMSHQLLLHSTYEIHITASMGKTCNSVDFELSSNVDRYYASDNHIYSLASMTTYVFLV